MIDALTTAQFALQNDQLQLQTITQNISNMNTTAYKSQWLEQNFVLLPSMKSSDLLQLSPQVLNRTMQGVLKETGRMSDLAFSSDGYFVLQTADGIRYSRRGDFQKNGQGNLVNFAGDLVLGQKGIIHIGDSDYRVESAGEIYIDNKLIDHLQLASFKNTEKLIAEGNGYFSAQEMPILPENIHLLQGYLEQANISSSEEMLAMLRTSRHFAASQHLLNTVNQLISTAIHQLGENNV